MFDRPQIRAKICHLLQTDYVALIGQRGTGVKTLIETLVNEKPSIPGMKFMFISLSHGINDDNEFKEDFLRQLIDTSTSMSSQHDFTDAIKQTLQQYHQFGIDFRLREVLRTLGKVTVAHPLVIVLNALPKVKKELLKNLLLMLREYHEQRNIHGAAGERLRFLVAGREKLWLLCRQRLDEVSPFNIAEPIFLDGLSCEEIQAIDKHHNFESAIKFRDLTDGVPSLVEKALKMPIDSEDLLPFFECLQDNWNLLPIKTRYLLKQVIGKQEEFPKHCIIDYKCPQIPEIDFSWKEAFWAGFLRIKHRELTWRSPIHRAFVMEHVQSCEKYSKSTVIKVDLFDRAKRLERALQRTQSPDCRDEYLEEALSLAVQSQRATELGPVLETSLKARRSLGDYDVFLCHNSKDKEAVKRIGIKLKERGILPWLDEWDLEPGKVWINELEIIISQVKSAVVCVGPNQTGPWEKIEIRTLLRKFVEGDLKVIPTILEGTNEEPDWSMFLDDFHRVDFRKQEPEPFEQLVWGITGQKPSLT